MLVTEAMVTDKSLQSGFEGAIMVSNKAMTQNQYQQKMYQVIKKLFYKSLIDTRGLLVHGLIHSQVS